MPEAPTRHDGPGRPPRPPPRWSLAAFFAGPDDPRLAEAEAELGDRLRQLTATFDERGVAGGPPREAADGDAELLAHLVGALDGAQEQARLLGGFLYAWCATSTDDERATTVQSRFQVASAALAVLVGRLEAWVARSGTAPLLRSAGVPAPVAHRLRHGAAGAARRMDDGREELAAELRQTGSVAWARLHRQVVGGLRVDLSGAGGGRREPIVAVRALAVDPDRDRRAEAHRAELEAWASVGVPLAAALDGAKGEALVLDRRRGWPDGLTASLHLNQVPARTFAAMQEAVDDALVVLRRYLRAKAALLRPGHGGGIAWHDLRAPVGAAGAVSWAEAVDVVVTTFGRACPPLADLARRALDERWVDAEPRPGRVGGAFSVGIRGDESRLLVDFDGSSAGVRSLAHELGHAFHHAQLAGLPALARRPPPGLAEVASTVCESLVFEAQLDAATDEDTVLGLLDAHLQGLTVLVVDVRSRFLFERGLDRARRDGVVGADGMCALMAEAQAQAYDDGLDPGQRHPWMWAAKDHYFRPYYNWPYTFGLLLGLGLRRDVDPSGPDFGSRFGRFLRRTGVVPVDALGADLGLDLAVPAGWAAGLTVVARHVERFVALAAPSTPPPDACATMDG